MACCRRSDLIRAYPIQKKGKTNMKKYVKPELEEILAKTEEVMLTESSEADLDAEAAIGVIRITF